MLMIALFSKISFIWIILILSIFFFTVFLWVLLLIVEVFLRCILALFVFKKKLLGSWLEILSVWGGVVNLELFMLNDMAVHFV